MHVVEHVRVARQGEDVFVPEGGQTIVFLIPKRTGGGNRENQKNTLKAMKQVSGLR